MKTLYESILSSTNSGKKSKLTKEYLFSLGWREGITFKSALYSPDEKHHMSKYSYDETFYTPVYNFGERLQYLCRIRTILDFDMLVKFWEETDELDKNKKEYKNKLKSFLEYLGKGGYKRSEMK
jgi:hypothetical protein